MLCIKPRQIVTLLTAATLLGGTYSAASAAVRIEGQVQAGGGALAGSTVSLYAASADAPTRLAQVQTDADGHFVLANDQTPGGEQIFYLVASGGVPAVNKAGGNNPAIELLTVVGNQPPAKVTINELTTVASAFTAARFIQGESISGNPLGLRIAAMNVPNLVNLQSGSWGSVIVDGLNLTRSTTLANFNTLASLVTYASTSASDDWRSRFFRRQRQAEERRRRTRWERSPALRVSRGHIPRTSSRSSRRPIRRRRRVCRTRRRLCLTCSTRQTTSRSSCAFRAVASTHRAG